MSSCRLAASVWGTRVTRRIGPSLVFSLESSTACHLNKNFGKTHFLLEDSLWTRLQVFEKAVPHKAYVFLSSERFKVLEGAFEYIRRSEVYFCLKN